MCPDDSLQLHGAFLGSLLLPCKSAWALPLKKENYSGEMPSQGTGMQELYSSCSTTGKHYKKHSGCAAVPTFSILLRVAGGIGLARSTCNAARIVKRHSCYGLRSTAPIVRCQARRGFMMLRRPRVSTVQVYWAWYMNMRALSSSTGFHA